MSFKMSKLIFEILNFGNIKLSVPKFSIRIKIIFILNWQKKLMCGNSWDWENPENLTLKLLIFKKNNDRVLLYRSGFHWNPTVFTANFRKSKVNMEKPWKAAIFSFWQLLFGNQSCQTIFWEFKVVKKWKTQRVLMIFLWKSTLSNYHWLSSFIYVAYRKSADVTVTEDSVVAYARWTA